MKKLFILAALALPMAFAAQTPAPATAKTEGSATPVKKVKKVHKPKVAKAPKAPKAPKAQATTATPAATTTPTK